MKRFKRQLYFSSLAIALILVFSIYSYYQIRGMMQKHQQIERAVDHLITAQSLTDEVVQTIVVLTVHAEAFSASKYAEHYNHLKNVVDSIKTAQHLLESLVAREEKLVSIRNPMALASSLHSNLIAQASIVLRDQTRTYLNDFPFVSKVRNNQAQLKKIHLDLHAQLEMLERNTEKEIAFLNRTVLVALGIALTVLVFLMLGPSVRKIEKSIQQKTEAEEKYRDLFNHNPIPIWIFDSTSGCVLEVNQRALQHYGYSCDEFTKMSLYRLWPESKQSEVMVRLKELQNDNAAINGRWTHVTKNGEAICVEMLSHKINYGKRDAVLILANDITSQVLLETQLLEEKISRQQEITKAVIHTQEKERSEIGKELHDNVNQVLTTIKLYIENIRAFPDQSHLFLEKSIDLTQRTINEVRFLAKQLVTPVMHDLGFKATVDELITHYKSLQLFELLLEFNVNEQKLETGVKLTMYRIIQEQLNNIVKHAKASFVKISIQEKDELLKVTVEDDGVGFDTQSVHHGIGLKNIRNRTEAYKGILKIVSSKGNGCTLEVSLCSRNTGDLDIKSTVHRLDAL